MSAATELFEAFAAEYRDTGEADALAYLERADTSERAELALLIDGFLARRPRRPSATVSDDLAARWQPAIETLERSLAGSSGSWPELLPRLRGAAGLRRAELVDRLAETLGVGPKREKVALYYHRMEQGILPANGVSDRVLEAIGTLLGTTGAALRQSGSALLRGGEHHPGPPAAAFARVASAPGDVAQAHTLASEGERDEVDDLFTGR